MKKSKYDIAFIVLILFVSSLIFASNKNNISCEPQIDYEFSDLDSCVKFTVGYIKRGGRSNTSLYRDIKGQLKEIQYQYFNQLKQSGCCEGTIFVTFTIDTLGNVYDLKFKKRKSKIRNKEFRMQVISIIQKWKFQENNFTCIHYPKKKHLISKVWLNLNLINPQHLKTKFKFNKIIDIE